MIWKGVVMTWKASTNTSKIVGVPEDKLKEKSWDDTEELVKGVIKENLKVNVEVKIERAHCVGKPTYSI